MQDQIITAKFRWCMSQNPLAGRKQALVGHSQRNGSLRNSRFFIAGLTIVFLAWLGYRFLVHPRLVGSIAFGAG